MSPYSRSGSVVNVIFSAVLGSTLILVGAITGTPLAVAAGVVGLGMSLFAFVPIMRRAKKRADEQKARDAEGEGARGTSP